MHMSLAFPWDRTLGQQGGIRRRGDAKVTILSKAEGNLTDKAP